MNDEITVSIICTAYNHGKYIRQALESFLMQKTDFKYEIIVNDDASTDDTAQTIREIAEKNPDRVVAIYQQRNLYSQGKDPTVDYMLPIARGKYIAFCEGDDYWCDENKLQIQSDWLDGHTDYSACVHNTVNLEVGSGKTGLYNPNFHGDRDLAFKDVVHGVGKVFHTSSLMARKEYVSSVPDYDTASRKHHVGDHPRSIYLALNGKIRYLDRTMSVYRINSTAFSWTSRMLENEYLVDRLHGAVEMYELLLGHLTGADRELTEKVLLEYKMNLLEAEGNYSEMKRGPYGSLFKKKSIKEKAWIEFKSCFPRIYCMYLRRTGREKSIPLKFRKNNE